MVISKNTQLGLQDLDNSNWIEFLKATKFVHQAEYDWHTGKVQFLEDVLTRFESGEIKEDYDLPHVEEVMSDGNELFRDISELLGYKPALRGSEFYTVKYKDSKYYLIQSTVKEGAERIRLKENFSSSIFKDVSEGEHIYLLGANRFFRFLKFNGAIRGLFWDRELGIAFEIGFHLEQDKYYYPQTQKTLFNELVRLMIFVEIGDIEIIELPAGRNNGKSKKAGKVTNTANYTVYVVDSTWNQLIIRTEGFAVMGHFRLQPCGVGFADRKLIWINAFEKHGYKRRPKAEIID